MPLTQRWDQKFTDIRFADDEEEEAKTLAERSKPWRRPSLEAPRRSLRPQESLEEHESIPWEDSEGRKRDEQIEELPYEVEEHEEEIHLGRGLKLTRRGSEDSYDDEPPRIDPRLYGDQDVRLDEGEVEVGVQHNGSILSEINFFVNDQYLKWIKEFRKFTNFPAN